MRSAIALACCALAGVTLSSCGGSRRVITNPDASSCGSAYVLQAAGRQIASNSCAGVIPAGDPIRVAVGVGERFEIEIAGEETGALDFPVPAPIGHGVRRLGRRSDLVTYLAISPGVTRLIAHHARYCMEAHSEPRYANCPVAVVRIAGR